VLGADVAEWRGVLELVDVVELRVQSEFLFEAPVNGRVDVLAGARVAAAAVRPEQRP